MTTRNRDTLKQFFQEGRLPTSDHFGDLIDSMLNMSDEGFRKTPENGVEVSTPVSHDALISFYREQSGREAIWSMAYGGDRDQLLFHHGDARAASTGSRVPALDTEGRVGIGTARPRQALEVAGVVASSGRLGDLRREDDTGQPLKADGEWHDLTGPLSGCQAFEVMAGVGQKDGGRFAMLHAIAMNTYNPLPGWLEFLSPRKRIRSQHAWYGRRCDRIQLRWAGGHGRRASYRLQIRTQCDYGEGKVIQASVSQLWFDPEMTGGTL